MASLRICNGHMDQCDAHCGCAMCMSGRPRRQNRGAYHVGHVLHLFLLLKMHPSPLDAPGCHVISLLLFAISHQKHAQLLHVVAYTKAGPYSVEFRGG
jgi:hypothetical protein